MENRQSENAPNYHQHEDKYRELRERGFNGWGAESLERRMLGWRETVTHLFASPLFPKPNAEILEIGSGAGDSSIPLVESGYRVSGIEISATAVKWAQEKFSKKGLAANFVQANLAESIPFEDSRFSAVIDSACFHCLIGGDRKISLNEIHRVLKPGGFLLVSHMVNDPRELSEDCTFNSVTRVQERSSIPYRSMPTYEGLIAEVASVGFELIRKELRQRPWGDHADLWFLKLN